LALDNIHTHSRHKAVLLLQYLSLTAKQSSGEPDPSVHRYRIIVPLLGRLWGHSNIHSTEVEPPRL